MKRFFRIHLFGEQSVWFDMPAENIELSNFISIMQAAGYIATENYWINAKAVKFIGVIQAETAQITPFTPKVV